MRSSLIILVWWSLFRNVLVVDHCQDRGLLRPAQLEQPSFSTSSLRRAASLLELMLMLLSGVKDRPRPSLRRNTSPRVMSTSSRWWEKNNLYQILLSILSILRTWHAREVQSLSSSKVEWCWIREFSDLWLGSENIYLCHPSLLMCMIRLLRSGALHWPEQELREQKRTWLWLVNKWR